MYSRSTLLAHSQYSTTFTVCFNQRMAKLRPASHKSRYQKPTNQLSFHTNGLDWSSLAPCILEYRIESFRVNLLQEDRRRRSRWVLGSHSHTSSRFQVWDLCVWCCSRVICLCREQFRLHRTWQSLRRSTHSFSLSSIVRRHLCMASRSIDALLSRKSSLSRKGMGDLRQTLCSSRGKLPQSSKCR